MVSVRRGDHQRHSPSGAMGRLTQLPDKTEQGTSLIVLSTATLDSTARLHHARANKSGAIGPPRISTNLRCSAESTHSTSACLTRRFSNGWSLTMTLRSMRAASTHNSAAVPHRKKQCSLITVRIVRNKKQSSLARPRKRPAADLQPERGSDDNLIFPADALRRRCQNVGEPCSDAHQTPARQGLHR
jgi:hypothetical protein